MARFVVLLICVAEQTRPLTQTTIHVLIIEDNVEHAQLLEKLLHSSEQPLFQVCTVHTAAEGVEKLRAGGIQMVLLDLTLPDCQGADTFSMVSDAARELPIDAVLGVVQAIDLMSYNSDEENSAELWYRLLNCGLKLSACVGTDALLDRSTEPLGGDRVYVKTNSPLTMENWLNGLKQGRSFVTNGPIPTLKVNTSDVGETCHLNEPGTVLTLPATPAGTSCAMRAKRRCV